MNTRLIDAAQLETYRRDGVVHLRGVFADWVAPLTAAIDRVIARSEDPSYPREREFRLAPQNPLTVSGGARGVAVGGTMALNVVPHDPLFERWILESPAAQLIAELTDSKQVLLLARRRFHQTW